MRSPLPALDAFVRDAASTRRPDDRFDTPLRAGAWFSLAQLAEQCAELPVAAREALRPALTEALAPFAAQRPTLHHEAQPAPVDPWLRLIEQMRAAAEAMERAGCLELAYTCVAAMVRLQANATVPRCFASTVHLGRIARQLGDLETATDCYEMVTSEATRLRDGPMAARGLIGLALVAGTKGNRPSERAYYERALRVAHPGGPVEIMACQGIMTCAVNAGQLADALLHGWRAYDLLGEDLEVRAMVLSTLALTAMVAGFPTQALAGFEHALGLSATPRVHMITLGGAMRAAARLGHAERVAQWQQDGLADVERASLPYESARFFVFAADAWVTLRKADSAQRCLDRARALADQHRLHEQQWQVEQLATAVSAIESPTPVTVQLDVPFITGHANRTVLRHINRLHALAG